MESQEQSASQAPIQSKPDHKVTPKLNAAFAKAQGKFVQPEKNKTVEVKKDGRLLYTTKYADLKNVIESFREELSKNGLSFTQKTIPGNRGWLLVLTLKHESGEYDETAMPINLEQGPQQVGSSLTYLKRYQAAAYFGIAADDDDDGNGAGGRGDQATFTENKSKRVNQKQPPASNPEKPKPDPIPKDKQYAPPVKEKPADPAEYVMPFGSEDVIGKKLIELNEATLRNILNWSGEEMIKTPPPKNVAQIVEVNAKVKAFFKTMGVSS